MERGHLLLLFFLLIMVIIIIKILSLLFLLINCKLDMGKQKIGQYQESRIKKLQKIVKIIFVE